MNIKYSFPRITTCPLWLQSVTSNYTIRKNNLCKSWERPACCLSVCPSVDIFDEFSRITGSFLIRFVIINTLLQIQNTNAKDRNIGSYLHNFSDQIFITEQICGYSFEKSCIYVSHRTAKMQFRHYMYLETF